MPAYAVTLLEHLAGYPSSSPGSTVWGRWILSQVETSCKVPKPGVSRSMEPRVITSLGNVPEVGKMAWDHRIAGILAGQLLRLVGELPY